MKLWAGRFNDITNELTDLYNNSIGFDIRLIEFDIKGSKAHIKALLQAEILSNEEYNLIDNGLDQVLKLYQDGEINFNSTDEDVHMYVERELINLIGDTAKKLHTARSRNDQVAVDTKLYTRTEITNMIKLLESLNKLLDELTTKHIQDLIPGTTHLQGAQPITLGFYFHCYKQMFVRDISRLKDNLNRMNINPLGSCALAGSAYNIDRFITTQELGFDTPCVNAMDGVSDRDYIIETLSDIAIIGVHLSKFAEDIIIFNSTIYNYITLDDQYSTGSSIMPQKKNPDIAELARGKSARLIGNLVQMLTLVKGTPLAYNKDFQEDKEHLFDSIDTIKLTLEVFTEMLRTSTFNTKKMYDDCNKGFLNATDLADYLVLKGVPFRDAHSNSGKLVKYAEDKEITLTDIPFETFKEASNLIEEDIYEYIDITNCTFRRTSYGSVGWLMEELKKQQR